MSSSSIDPNRSSTFGDFRRIITSHPESDTDGSRVHLDDRSITLQPVLNGQAHLSPFFSHNIPNVTPHSISQQDILDSTDRVKGVVYKDGVNGMVTDLAPNFRVDYHRTHSKDYNVILKGTAYLITPAEDGSGREIRTEVKPGEVVVQNGTIHAWESGPEGARWVTVIVAAEPVTVPSSGKTLPEVDF